MDYKNKRQFKNMINKHHQIFFNNNNNYNYTDSNSTSNDINKINNSNHNNGHNNNSNIINLNNINDVGINVGSNDTIINNNDDDDDDSIIPQTFIEKIFIICSYVLLISTFPISLFVCLKIVQEYERAVIFRLGKLVGGGAKGPGLFFVLPCIDDYSVVDLRTITYDVPPQEILTKDSVTVSVDAVLYYRIWLPTIAVSNVYDYGQATQLLTSVTLRNILGTRTLAEILCDRKKIGLDMSQLVDEVTKTWGVEIERVELKDVRLPSSLQRSMAVEAEATREARSKIISSKGELKSSYGLKEASDILSTESMAMPLRFLLNLNSKSYNKDTTILFPIPIPMLTVKV